MRTAGKGISHTDTERVRERETQLHAGFSIYLKVMVVLHFRFLLTYPKP